MLHDHTNTHLEPLQCFPSGLPPLNQSPDPRHRRSADAQQRLSVDNVHTHTPHTLTHGLTRRRLVAEIQMIISGRGRAGLLPFPKADSSPDVHSNTRFSLLVHALSGRVNPCSRVCGWQVERDRRERAVPLTGADPRQLRSVGWWSGEYTSWFKPGPGSLRTSLERARVSVRTRVCVCLGARVFVWVLGCVARNRPPPASLGQRVGQ